MDNIEIEYTKRMEQLAIEFLPSLISNPQKKSKICHQSWNNRPKSSSTQENFYMWKPGSFIDIDIYKSDSYAL